MGSVLALLQAPPPVTAPAGQSADPTVGRIVAIVVVSVLVFAGYALFRRFLRKPSPPADRLSRQ